MGTSITKLEIKERREYVTSTGMEVQRRFYVEPYEAHTELMAILLGRVAENGTRIYPDQDSYYRACFCCEVQLDEQHPLAFSSVDTYSGAATPEAILVKTAKKEKPSNIGCYMWATYKPMRFALPLTSGASTVAFNPARFSAFDMVNPLMVPFQKTASVGKNAKFTVEDNNAFGLEILPYGSMDSDAFITQSFAKFTIERRMLAYPPYQMISLFKGKVNEYQMNFGPPFIFDAQTLRFDDAEIIPRISFDTTGYRNIWYDVVYSFSYNAILDRYWNGSDFTTGLVTWNRVLGCPMCGIWGTSSWLPIKLPTGQMATTAYYPVGWKLGSLGSSGVRKLFQTDREAATAANLEVYNDFRELFYNDIQPPPLVI